MSEYNKFLKLTKKTHKSGKTLILDVMSLTDDLLGHIKWYGPWRKYVFFPREGTLFDKTCLMQLADLCDELSSDHRKKKMS